MKKIKRLLAILGCVLLVSLYISTLVFALIGSNNAMNLFRASIYATIVLPVLIWAYTFIYRLLKDHYAPKKDDDSEETENEPDSVNDKTSK